VGKTHSFVLKGAFSSSDERKKVARPADETGRFGCFAPQMRILRSAKVQKSVFQTIHDAAKAFLATNQEDFD